MEDPNRSSTEDEVTIKLCEEQLTPATKNKLKTKVFQWDQKITEITAAICALFNSCRGGYLTLRFDEQRFAIKASEPKTVDDLVRRIEQSVVHFVGVATASEVFSLQENAEDDHELVFFVNSVHRICTIEYHMYLPTDFQVIAITFGDSTAKIAALLEPGPHDGIVVFQELPGHFRYKEKTPLGLREGQTAQFKLLKNEATKNVTLADRITNKTNKMVNCVSAFANYDGGKLYFGVDDKTYKVEGQVVNKKEEEKIKRRVLTVLSKMIWPVKEHERFWRIDFVPVLMGEQQREDTFVVVLSVAKCPGGVFVAEPESYHMVNGKVSRIPLSLWKQKFKVHAKSAGCANSGAGCANSGTGCANSGAGCANSGAGCANSGAGCANSGAGCANSGAGCANSGAGCANSGAGCANSGAGCANSGAGCANSGAGCAIGGTGCANSGVGCANSGVGCANSGTGCANSGAGCANSGTGGAGCANSGTGGAGCANSGTGCANSGAGCANSGAGCANSGTGCANSGAGCANSGDHYPSSGSVVSRTVQLRISTGVGAKGWNSTKQEDQYMKVTEIMENLRNNGNWAEINKIADKLLVPGNTNADLKLVVTFQCTAAAYRQTKNTKAYSLLQAYHNLIKLAKNPVIFEVQELYSWSAIKRSERDYQASYSYTYNALQKMQLIVPSWITAWFLCNAASLLTILASNEADPELKMSLIIEAECYYRTSLEHAQSIKAYKKAAANLRHRVHINLAMLYMVSSPNASSVNFEQTVSPDHLKSAQESLNAAAHFEGPTMTGFNKFYFLLAKSDLYFRYFQLNPETNQGHITQAILYANNACKVATENDFAEVLHYAEHRVSLLQSIPLKEQNESDIVDDLLNDIMSKEDTCPNTNTCSNSEVNPN